MTRDRVLRTMSKLFNLSQEAIGENPALGDVEWWDSLNHIYLITALEKEFKIKFDDNDFEAMVNLDTIVFIIDSYFEK